MGQNSRRAVLAAKQIELSHSECLELVSRQFGRKSWNVLSASIEGERARESPIGLRAPVPVLRIFSREKAIEFYVDFLGFEVDLEHRLAADAPLYLQVSRSDVTLHLSEHHGDATPAPRSSSG